MRVSASPLEKDVMPASVLAVWPEPELELGSPRPEVDVEPVLEPELVTELEPELVTELEPELVTELELEREPEVGPEPEPRVVLVSESSDELLLWLEWLSDDSVVVPESDPPKLFSERLFHSRSLPKMALQPAWESNKSKAATRDAA